MKSTRHRLLGFLFVLGIALSAFGDGKIFPPVAYVRAETPSQRALIHWHEGIETLAVETTVRSEASELGWILPLPSQPLSIQPADPGLFPTLQTLFQPRVLTETDWSWAGGLAVCAVGLLVRWRLQRKISITFVDCIVVLGVILILVSMLLPSLGKAKGGGAPERLGLEPEVTILSEVHAGVFDVITLAATKSDHLVAWLKGQGFAAPDEIIPVAQDYLDRGWVFVAARVQNPTPGVVTALHPLVFRFASHQAIYPMRLTGVGTDSLDCDLYVFGQGRAEAAGWKVRYCGIPDFASRTIPAMGPFPLRIRNEELATLVAGSTTATKLSARLSAQGLSEDVLLRWQPSRAEGQTLHSWNSALSQGLFYAAWILAGVAVFGWILSPRVAGPAPWFSHVDRMGTVLAAAACAVVFLMIPKAPSGKIERMSRKLPGNLRSSLIELTADAYDLPAVQAYLRLSEFADRTNGLHAVRAAMIEHLRTYRLSAGNSSNAVPLLNPFMGGPIRLETAPGNINLQMTADGLDLIWYDFDGAPAIRCDMPRAERPTDTPTNPAHHFNR